MRFFIVLEIIFLTGCATGVENSKLSLPEPLRLPQPTEVAYTKPEEAILQAKGAPPPQIKFSPTPTVPNINTGESQLKQQEFAPTFKMTAPIKVNLEGLPLPAFINEVFGNLLGLSFEIAQEVQDKKELVTLRVNDPQTPEQLYKLARQVLVNYGIELQMQGEIMRFILAKPGDKPPPSLIFTGSTLPDVPPSHRSIIQFITLKVVGNALVRNWLQQAFQGQPINILEDYTRNAIILVGTPQIVAQAAETIKVLDQPAMRGKHSLRIEPAFIPATTLAQRLTEVLSNQGYQVTGSLQGGSIITLPIPETNSLIIFANDPNALEYVQEWAQQLDKINPSPLPNKPNLFFYSVKNTSAQQVAGVINSLQQSSTPMSVDPIRNAIIFLGTNEDWIRILPILQDLDKPAKQVLIEVTVAEITLSNKDERGIEWVLNRVGLGGLSGRLGTLGTLGVGSAGITYTLSNAGEARAILNAFISDSRATVLSTPRLMVRSGGNAGITVGNEVPTLTSQANSNQLQGGNSGISVNQIQYRRTGISLNIQPVVYAGRRVDITISQEVSSSQPNNTSSIDSPIILNRNISTQLTLNDGQSILLGGLISNSQSGGESGVPILRDIPIIGQLFRANKQSQDRTELVIMLVPYVIEGDDEAKAISEAFKRRLQMLPLTPNSPKTGMK